MAYRYYLQMITSTCDHELQVEWYMSLRISSNIIAFSAAVVEPRIWHFFAEFELEALKNHWQCMNLSPIPKVFCAPLFRSSNVTDLAVSVYIVSLNLACLEPFKLKLQVASTFKFTDVIGLGLLH